jgi:aryl-alcohol dehydrogenase-like predicted oxidoreductase
MDAASDLGVTLLDTADSYGQGEAEKIIGRAIRGRRERYVVSTKAGYSFGRPPWWLRTVKPILQPLARRLRGLRNVVGAVRRSAPASGLLRQNFAPEYVAQRLDDSLRRLGTDFVDLFFLHDATLAALGDESLRTQLRVFRQLGKVRVLGVSSNDPEVLAAALEMEGVAVLQTAVNPRRGASLRPVLAAAEAKGVGVIGNQCFLAGRLHEEKFAALRETVQKLAVKHACSADGVLLAFSLGQPAVACALTGTRQAARLREHAAAAAALPALEADDFEELLACHD